MQKTKQDTLLVEIACAVDESYVPHCAAMLESVFSNTKSKCRIHLFYREIRPRTLNALNEYVLSRGGEFRSYYVDKALLQKFPLDKFHESCWYRILIPEIILDIEKIIYLDSDIIVNCDLTVLFNIEIRDYLFGAVSNPLYPFLKKRVAEDLGIKDESDYLNSGVMLMNLAKMRKCKTAATIQNYARTNQQNIWPEQDALSVVCIGNWLKLPPKWNIQSVFYTLNQKQSIFTKKDLNMVKSGKGIIHFTEPVKPWSFLCRHPKRHLYKQYRKRTPWSDFRFEDVSIKNFGIRLIPVLWQRKLRKLLAVITRLWKV